MDHSGFNTQVGNDGDSIMVSCIAGHFGGGLKTCDAAAGKFLPEVTCAPCLAGRWCPRGSTTPQGAGPCAAGYVCLAGSTTSLGVGPCGRDFFCPAGNASSPIALPLGLCSYRTDNAREGFVDGTGHDAVAACGGLRLPTPALVFAVMRPQTSASQELRLEHTGDLPVTVRLQAVTVPAFVKFRTLDGAVYSAASSEALALEPGTSTVLLVSVDSALVDASAENASAAVAFEVRQAWDSSLVVAPAPNASLALSIASSDLLAVPFVIRVDVEPGAVTEETISFYNIQVGAPPLQNWTASVRPLAAAAWLTLSRDHGTIRETGSTDTLVVVVNASGAPPWYPAQEEAAEVCVVTLTPGASESCVSVHMHVRAGPAVIGQTTPWQFAFDASSVTPRRLPYSVRFFCLLFFLLFLLCSL